jgi:GTP:adenosylcobinamide-phosphate guanylyltransferase
LRLTDENFKEIAIAASVANINTPEELKGIKGAQRPDGE